MMLTERQKQAINRSKAIFRLKGCIATLKYIKEDIFRSYMLKGMINSAIITLERLLDHIQVSKLSSYETYLQDYKPIKKL